MVGSAAPESQGASINTELAELMEMQRRAEARRVITQQEIKRISDLGNDLVTMKELIKAECLELRKCLVS